MRVRKIACKRKNYTQIAPQTYSCLSIDIFRVHCCIARGLGFLCSTCFAGSDDIQYETFETGSSGQPLVATSLETKQLLVFLKKNGFVVAKRH